MTIHPGAILIGNSAAFEERLNKTGLLYQTVGADDRWPESAALYIWAGETASAPKERLSRLLSAGRFLLVPEKCLESFEHRQSKNVRSFPDAWLVDIPTGKPSCVKTFVFGSARPREEVAVTPRARACLELSEKVNKIYSEQRLACPRFSFYPPGFSGLFSFRVDADEYEPKQFERFFETAKKYSHAISIFFSTANYERHMDQIMRCVDHGFDVHSHAHTHFTYNSYAQNLLNLRKADLALSKAGVSKKGFASPYGRWNLGLQRAIDEQGYDFSSEFSYNYDDLPSYPVVDGRRSPVLQLPVHAVGLGVYLESTDAYNENEVKEYYSGLFQQRYAQGQPILFYDHPTKWLGVYPEFMDFIFGLAAAHSDIWICSMSEWAAWWKKRDQTRLHLTQEAVSHDFSAPTGAGKLHWKSVSNMNADNSGGLFQEKSVVRRIKNFIKNWLDWETLTPREEIVRESFSSWLKYTLRGIRH